MIYKITNIRLRNGRTLNRGFIIESDKMLSRNKIATLIKERTNFTPVDFSSKMHRSLLESQEDVDAAIAAGTARRNANVDKNNEIDSKHKKFNELKEIKTKIDSINKKIRGLNREIASKQESDIKPLEIDKKKKEEAFNTASKEFTTAKQTYEDSLKNIITPLENEVKQWQEQLKQQLGSYENEKALDKEINDLKSQINNNAKLENKIAEDEGVNLATVEKYFNTKRKHLDEIIKKFRDLVKTTTNDKTKKTTVVYNNLNTLLDKFSESFDEIETEVIKQYKSTRRTPKEQRVPNLNKNPQRRQNRNRNKQRS